MLGRKWLLDVTCTTLKSSKALNCSIDEFWTGKIIKGMTRDDLYRDQSWSLKTYYCIPYFPFLDSWTTCPVHAFLTETPCFCWGENMLKESLESNVHLNWWNPRPVLGVETSWLASQFFLDWGQFGRNVKIGQLNWSINTLYIFVWYTVIR